jgi:4-hydroxy-3-methylbut-2-enyl diphosphate reductase
MIQHNRRSGKQTSRTKQCRIIIARTAGFCFGVRRAITLAEEMAQTRKKIYTLGPIIHNPQEIDRLAALGVKPVEHAGNIRGGSLVIRTHGIPALQRRKLEARKLELVDATCPFVKRAQDIVRQLHAEGYYVVIVGERTHPEVVALVSYGGAACRIVESKDDVIALQPNGRIGVVSQTTQTQGNFNDVIRALKKQHGDVKVFNTICRATMDRQADARRLARRVDVMIVVGGKNSGNTRRLAEISREYATTWHIETSDELKAAWVKGVHSIGITAGASTPDWIIRQVKERIEFFSKNK